MAKTIDTLIADMHDVFLKDHVCSEAGLKELGETVAACVKRSFEECHKKEPFGLRMSKLGTKNRKLWFDAHEPEEHHIDPATEMKFLYGHIIEAVVLFLAKEAGHKVEGEQGEVVVDGVVGHRDAKIDGITTDVKTASSYGFRKFARGTLHEDDPFGYIAQISGYTHADNSPYGAFLAINKESGDMTLLKVQPIDMINVPDRVAEVKHVVELSSPPPEKCYEAIPAGKSGNLGLNSNCGYCRHKLKCWADANGGKGLRKFQYSDGVKYLVRVEEEPRVPEILGDNLTNQKGD